LESGVSAEDQIPASKYERKELASSSRSTSSKTKGAAKETRREDGYSHEFKGSDHPDSHILPSVPARKRGKKNRREKRFRQKFKISE
jgi:hypothetical protein